MKQFFLKKWFLVGLAVTITGGILYGWQRPQGIESVTEFVHPRWLTGFVLFLMSITLDSRQLRSSFRPRSGDVGCGAELPRRTGRSLGADVDTTL